MKQKAFSIVFKELPFGEKIKICQKIADTSFNKWTLDEVIKIIEDFFNAFPDNPEEAPKKWVF